MRTKLLLFVGLLIIIIENSITNFIPIFSVNVNIVLIYIVFISLYLREIEAIFIGMILGLIIDISVGGILGVSTIGYMLSAYFISSVRNKIFRENISIIVGMVLVVTIANNLFEGVLSIYIYGIYHVIYSMIKALLIAPILNAVVGYLLYKLFNKQILYLKEEISLTK